MRGKKETIVLDGMLADVITSRAFVVELDNGHRLRAWTRLAREGGWRVGGRVTVACCPGDMSRGRVIGVAPMGERTE